MGTRSIIMVKHGDNVKRLYRHNDGYPTANLDTIYNALKGLSKTKHYKLASFIRLVEDQYRTGMVEEEFTILPKSQFDTDMLGGQSDLEWIYTVDLDAKQIKVFGGGYTGETPNHMYNKGTVDPLLYADRLREQFKDNERKSIQLSVDAIKSLGYTLNKG